MVEILKEELKDFANVEIIQADILKIDLRPYILNLKSYKVVGNLPFYLTLPVIRNFLEMTGIRPLSMTLIVQKEVAQRICAQPPKMNLLAVSVQFYAKPEIISYISKKSFWPQPKVNSAIIKILPKSPLLNNYPPDELFGKRFFQIVRAGFSQPRKMLINNLAAKLKIEKEKIKEILRKNNINPCQRPETLTIKDWQNLTWDFSSLL
jgi:16S rRNA (adenine1518-N6/adenine1519-N6)-dimethyltransferase